MKLHLYLYALLLASFMYGQEEDAFTIPKGTKEIGLALTYNYQKNKNEGAFVNPVEHIFALRPSVGVALKDNLILGAQVNFTAIRETIDGDKSDRIYAPDVQTYGIGFFPYLKKYIPIGKKLLFNIQGNVGYEHFTQEEFNQNYTIKQNLFSLGFTPGITFSISSKLALKGDIGVLRYVNTKTEDSRNNSNTIKQQNFDFNFSASNILLGLVYFIK